MNIDYKNIYFVGIGGIGMSALARFFKHYGYNVAGYDAVRTHLTQELENESIDVHYTDDIKLIPENFLQSNDTLIIYTPAIPKTHTELQHFTQQNFKILKRAQILGLLSKELKSVGIAGTHGKTTISALTSHIFKANVLLNAAFVGGIVKNYKSNLILGEPKNSNWLVLESDEFDRSFLNLHPDLALISAVDADHLDIYKEKENVDLAFIDFLKQTKETAVINDRVEIKVPEHLKVVRYGLKENSDFYAHNIRVINGKQVFDIKHPNGICKDIEIQMPGKVNIENSTGAFAIGTLVGIDAENIKKALGSFTGIERRFDTIFKNENVLYINDYAHHPAEIERLAEAVSEFYPNRKITAIFQPHLFSRTKDFADGFADVLSKFDEIILMNIYPARELPIEGVTSQIILDKITNSNKMLCDAKNIVKTLENRNLDIILTIGAGDIDNLVEPIKQHLINNY